jgi:uncharacterized sporulation protein YeaH/YhbH (DUF444 family)
MSDNPIIIDRRKHTTGKSISNRQRFLDRVKKTVRDAAKRKLSDRSISDTSGESITIPSDGINEPKFRHKSDQGDWDYVLPGNEEYLPGDKIQKPKQQGGGKGGSGNGDDETEDEFNFVLSYDEYINIIFDDLELPDLIKASEKNTVLHSMQRAGYTTTGMPTNLNVKRTMLASIGRRLALATDETEEIEKLEEELKNTTNKNRILEIQERIQNLREQIEEIPFIDNVDLRYNNFVKVPKPITQAVMFCVMDVSYSMGEEEKIIAKKFFILLYLFLKKKYKNLEVVFVRHHHTAEECDEKTFFTDRSSGGTTVSTAYSEVDRIIKDRYPVNDWNIYLAQASDGDNATEDRDAVHTKLNKLLSDLQYMAYIEIVRRGSYASFGIPAESEMWESMEKLEPIHKNLQCRKIQNERQVIDVFRSLFSKVKV